MPNLERKEKREITTLTPEKIKQLEDTLKNFITNVKKTGKLENLPEMFAMGHGSHAQQ